MTQPVVPIEQNPSVSLNQKGRKGAYFLVALFVLLVSSSTAFFGLKIAQNHGQLYLNQSPVSIFTFQAQVTYLVGPAWKLENGQQLVLQENDFVKEGETVITGEDARLVLVFDEGSIVRLDSQTQVSLNQLKSAAMVLSEKSGILFARVNKDEAHKFLVQAGGVEIESWGTAFSVSKQEEEVEVKVFESKVKIKENKQEKVEVREKEKWQKKTDKVEKLTQADVVDEFLSWSLEQEGQKLFPNPSPTLQPLSPSGEAKDITLTGQRLSDNKVELSWTVNGSSALGYKVLWSPDPEPTYPCREQDKYFYNSSPDFRSDTVTNLKPGQTYYFRVCEYLGGQCGTYSNQLSF